MKTVPSKAAWHTSIIITGQRRSDKNQSAHGPILHTRFPDVIMPQMFHQIKIRETKETSEAKNMIYISLKTIKVNILQKHIFINNHFKITPNHKVAKTSEYQLINTTRNHTRQCYLTLQRLITLISIYRKRFTLYQSLIQTLGLIPFERIQKVNNCFPSKVKVCKYMEKDPIGLLYLTNCHKLTGIKKKNPENYGLYTN